MQLVIYLILISLLAIFFVYTSLAIMHSFKFSYLSKRTKKITIIFGAISAILIISALSFLLMVNWDNF